jgi:hypothetical protein
MATFPRTESDVAILADEMIAGFAAHTDVYPAPPVTSEGLTTIKDAYLDAHNAVVAAQAALEQAHMLKDDMFASLITQMKIDLRYAENTAHGSDDLLMMIGWSGRKTPTPQPAPGQTRLLTVVRQEDSQVDLDWKAPDNGGKPNAYRVVRRERPAGPWLDVATAVTTAASLLDQPRGKEYEYRVIAVNKVGEGEPSNTVVVVL